MAIVKSRPRKSTTAAKRSRAVSSSKRKTDVAASYNRYKLHKGKQYSGLQVGRGIKLRQLENETLSFVIEQNGHNVKGEAIPIPETCTEEGCTQFEISLNDENLGMIRWTKGGWKMEGVEDKRLIRSIGEKLNPLS